MHDYQSKGTPENISHEFEDLHDEIFKQYKEWTTEENSMFNNQIFKNKKVHLMVKNSNKMNYYGIC